MGRLIHLIIVLDSSRVASMFFCVKGVSLKMLRWGKIIVGGGGAWEGLGDWMGAGNFYLRVVGCLSFVKDWRGD